MNGRRGDTVFTRLFLEHPRSLGESYLQHQLYAFRFGLSLIAAGSACLVHGLVPALFPRAGSSTVTRLYDRMAVDRAGRRGEVFPSAKA